MYIFYIQTWTGIVATVEFVRPVRAVSKAVTDLPVWYTVAVMTVEHSRTFCTSCLLIKHS